MNHPDISYTFGLEYQDTLTKNERIYVKYIEKRLAAKAIYCGRKGSRSYVESGKAYQNQCFGWHHEGVCGSWFEKVGKSRVG